MDWTPILEASLPIRAHFFTVVPAFAVGTWQIFFSTKGTLAHKYAGYTYFALMSLTAFAAFFIRSSTGGLSLIHLFIPLTVFSIASAWWSIRKGNVEGHKHSMYGLYIGGLLIAGALTFMPGRRMYAVFFGG